MRKLILTFIFIISSIFPGITQDTASKDKDLENTVYLDTIHGRITILLRPDLTPKNVEHVKTLIKSKFYDGIAFHRVISGALVQAGDPTGTGGGGSDLPNVPGEFTMAPFKRGSIGMALGNGPDSGNAQFFILISDQYHLNNGFSNIGNVISGMDVVEKIKKGKNGNDMVENPDKIIKMRMATDEEG